jgi:hypothetical protein
MGGGQRAEVRDEPAPALTVVVRSFGDAPDLAIRSYEARADERPRGGDLDRIDDVADREGRPSLAVRGFLRRSWPVHQPREAGEHHRGQQQRRGPCAGDAPLARLVRSDVGGVHPGSLRPRSTGSMASVATRRK